jgi:hypothetical protein
LVRLLCTKQVPPQWGEKNFEQSKQKLFGSLALHKADKKIYF